MIELKEQIPVEQSLRMHARLLFAFLSDLVYPL